MRSLSPQRLFSPACHSQCFKHHKNPWVEWCAAVPAHRPWPQNRGIFLGQIKAKVLFHHKLLSFGEAFSISSWQKQGGKNSEWLYCFTLNYLPVVINTVAMFVNSRAFKWLTSLLLVSTPEDLIWKMYLAVDCHTQWHSGDFSICRQAIIKSIFHHVSPYARNSMQANQTVTTQQSQQNKRTCQLHK